MANPYRQPIMRDVMENSIKPDMLTDEEQAALTRWNPAAQDPLKYYRPLPKGPVLTDEPLSDLPPVGAQPDKYPIKSR